MEVLKKFPLPEEYLSVPDFYLLWKKVKIEKIDREQNWNIETDFMCQVLDKTFPI